MPKKLTQEECISRMIQTHGAKYDYSLVIFINSKTKIDIICPIHGTFTQIPEAHYSGQGCPNCRLTKITETNIKKHGVKWNSQIPTKIEKTKQTNLERYGHENIAQGKLKEKVEQTNLERYGGHPRKNKQVQEKQKVTNLDRYGVEHFTNQQKREQTNLERYGFINPLQNQEIYEKSKHIKLEKYGDEYYTNRDKYAQTCLGRYGVSSVLSIPSIRANILKTNLELYGVEYPQQNDTIKQLRINNVLNKYGVKNIKQQHMINIIHLLEDSEWMLTQYVHLKKPSTQIAQELGISVTTVLNYIHKHNIEIIFNYGFSMKAIRWLEQISNEQNIYIQHALNKGEYSIPNTKYRADGYCEETNTIYEFHGDIFHGNLNIFDNDDICNPWSDLTAKQLFDKTKERELLITKLGYNVTTMWEQDFDNQEKII